MKRLLASYKFWCALIATIAVGVLAKFGITSDAVLLALISMWGVVIGGQAWKDAADIKHNDTPKPTVGTRPNDRE